MEQSKTIKQIKKKIIFHEQINSEKKLMEKIKKIFKNDDFYNFFKKDHFKRDWIYYFDEKNDQHIFFLNAPSLGKLNNRLKNFYENN